MRPVDFDRDGDMDLLAWQSVYIPNTPTQYELKIIRNHVRHLAAPAEVLPGQPLNVDMTANHQRRMVLAISPRQQHSPIPGWGDLMIDPAAMFVLPAKMLLNRQKASWNFQLPAQPTLIGLELHFQALDVPLSPWESPRLTRPARTRIVQVLSPK